VEQDFDLLGDPIPEGFGKRGRPQHIPTQENRSKVIVLMAVGWPDQRIANALAITPPTLRKHYFRELRARDEARDRVAAGRLARLWAEGQKGNVGALKEFGRLFDQAEAARTAKEYGDESPAERLGKKEAARKAAETAGEGSDWGADLLGRQVN
jgi:hypothetical protein